MLVQNTKKNKESCFKWDWSLLFMIFLKITYSYLSSNHDSSILQFLWSQYTCPNHRKQKHLWSHHNVLPSCSSLTLNLLMAWTAFLKGGGRKKYFQNIVLLQFHLLFFFLPKNNYTYSKTNYRYLLIYTLYTKW